MVEQIRLPHRPPLATPVPMKISNDSLLGALGWRYAVKKFDSAKKISATDWETLENAVVLSPSSYGLQPWKFLVIQNPELRSKLKPASWNQSQVVDASHFVVFLVRNTMDEKYVARFIDDTAKTRGIPAESMKVYRDMILSDLVKGPRSKQIREWAARQTYIALGNMMTCAAVMGIDACPMEGFQPEKYDELLELRAGDYSSLVCLALGYRSADDKYASMKKVRFSKADVVQYV